MRIRNDVLGAILFSRLLAHKLPFSVDSQTFLVNFYFFLSVDWKLILIQEDVNIETFNIEKCAQMFASLTYKSESILRKNRSIGLIESNRIDAGPF